MAGRDRSEVVEVIPGELAWTSSDQTPHDSSTRRYFNIDSELCYEPFVSDFGPLSLAATWRYCRKLEKLLAMEAGRRTVVHVCGTHPHKKANAACLAAAFLVICRNYRPDRAWLPFSSQNFIPFRDATYGNHSADLPIIDVLRGLKKGMQLGWFDYKTFDPESFEFYERVENGDFNWIIPGKMLAFAGPSMTSRDQDGYEACTPEYYSPIFKREGISLVVRLNKPSYDRQRFITRGIKHLELYFADGSCPSKAIVERFLSVADAEPGALAVHCKAGLGRTATLIGLFAMKNYDISAEEFVGWARLARPGSILGPQHEFLREMEPTMKQARRQNVAEANSQVLYPPVSQHRVRARDLVSPDSPYGKEDRGQGERLVSAKRAAQSTGSSPVRTPGSSPARSPARLCHGLRTRQ
mmetsp:Transcript_31827/g.69650  ORF Transcript_31827/g.69650 Transcript_31827/m.69650 type:complete len:411 (+) Transcript_31827:38-1270(+)|eukprot:CAMPEP_0204270970 /NCGR_PEP_ID=MMETSP0468-20130131/19192_1 /ASSEMBLY_ACC=CAM_ASM_000383 /TAXON_ID=2969 /ORGANISM="Oxyrrhis marina" /LENGTH=410 /DNA_ID=CAMNT_0051246569 /DNA_START=32 /DNA_END=1264 /DNA_ORIENTATION=+